MITIKENDFILDSVRTIAVLGDRDTGKTNLVFSLLKNYKGNKEIVLYAYPNPRGYRNIYSLQELASTQNAIVFMDELQNHIKFYSKNTNDAFLELLATMAHNNNTLIFTTPMSQFITKSLDVFIDCFVYTKMLDMGSLKNGSKAKRLLQENSFKEITPWGVNLFKGEYILISEYKRGKFYFENQNIPKDWNAQTFANNLPKRLPNV